MISWFDVSFVFPSFVLLSNRNCQMSDIIVANARVATYWHTLLTKHFQIVKCCQSDPSFPSSDSCCCSCWCSASRTLRRSSFLLAILLHATSCSPLVIWSQLSIRRVVPSALMMTGPISSNLMLSVCDGRKKEKWRIEKTSCARTREMIKYYGNRSDPHT